MNTEKLIKKLKQIGENKRVAIRINDEFAVYTSAKKIIEGIEKNGKVFFEDGCYDVFLDFSKNENSLIGWYKRYGLLSFENGKPVFFRDGDNWKISCEEIEHIPYFFHEVKEQNHETGFYNLQEEIICPEEDYEKTYNCYFFEPVYNIKIKEFDTDEVLDGF